MFHSHVGIILDELEKVMANIGHRLMIKYGLPNAPSSDLITRWRTVTNSLIGQGFSAESSGRSAAKQIFPGFETRFYASEADDIVTRLDAAGNS